GVPSRLIGGTKGSHILLDHPELLGALAGRMIYFEANDGRICLVYDYLGRALVGSTDIRAADPDAVRCEDDEVDYFIASLRELLPKLAFDRSQIVYAYSGIRPLPASDGTAPGLISRDHSSRARTGGRAQLADRLAGRRQMDNLPRLRRGSRRPGAEALRPIATRHHAGNADRRWPR